MRRMKGILENEGDFNHSSGVLPQDQGSIMPMSSWLIFSFAPEVKQGQLDWEGDQEKWHVRRMRQSTPCTVGAQHLSY